MIEVLPRLTLKPQPTVAGPSPQHWTPSPPESAKTSAALASSAARREDKPKDRHSGKRPQPAVTYTERRRANGVEGSPKVR